MSVTLPRRNTPDAGFALLDAVMASALLVIAASGTAQLMAVATRATSVARHGTLGTIIAAQKMEQLGSLAWRTDLTGAISDTTTNLSVEPASTGGPGLMPSPAGALDRNIVPYVDHIDGAGRWLGSSAVPPAGAVYTRRWSVTRLATDPDDTLVLRVRVLSAYASTGPGRQAGGIVDVLLVSLKTRRSR